VLDFHPAVKSIREQPFSLYYDLEGVKRRYTPDVLAEWSTPHGHVKTIVYEVKPIDELRANWKNYRPRFKAAVRYCRSRGWKFKIVTEREIRTPYLKNAQFLRRYRALDPQTLIGDQLLYTLKALGPTTPQALLAASYLYQDTRLKAIPELWRLVACGQIGVFLNEKLTMNSTIWLAGA
tara:strand:+ start:26197 stop:26733 length:537 start_codon:yes stop_codon:yes gene_type:complete